LTNASTPASSVIAGLKQALKPHAPFAAMRDADVDRIVRGARIAYFPSGTPILGPGSERPTHCYVVRQGTVRGERPAEAGSPAAVWELAAGEMFPLAALVARRPVTSVYRAIQDTFCLLFAATLFDALLEESAVFQDFCTRRLAHLLDLSRAQLQAEYLAAATEQRGFATPLSSLLRRAAVTCASDTPLAEALATIETQRVGSLPVVAADGALIGIFTRQDVIGRVVLPQRAPSTPVREVMSAPVITLRGDATAGDAALLMADKGIRHIVVSDADGHVAGVVSERDLFTLQRLSVRELASEIRRALDVGGLVRYAADVRALSHALVAQGLAATQLTRMISTLNDRIAVRVLELLAPEFELEALTLCWLGMGSEGRSEQTIATDQDNGLIFDAPPTGPAADAIRGRLLPFATAANEALDRCGYPLCKGGVMAMNPRWCASLDEWKNAFAHWIDRGDPHSLLAANVFFDFRALWGDPSLADALRADVAARAQANSRFLKQMSDNALANRPPLGWLGDLEPTGNEQGVEGIDLKMSCSAPFVDAARIFALASGVTATGTIERLQHVAARGGLPADEARAFGEAFEFVQLQRLRTQHWHAVDDDRDAANPNFIPLAELSELDRRILTEALRQVRRIQQRLELDFPG
jgi:CBS domain-containing protein